MFDEPRTPRCYRAADSLLAHALVHEVLAQIGDTSLVRSVDGVVRDQDGAIVMSGWAEGTTIGAHSVLFGEAGLVRYEGGRATRVALDRPRPGEIHHVRFAGEHLAWVDRSVKRAFVRRLGARPGPVRSLQAGRHVLLNEACGSGELAAVSLESDPDRLAISTGGA